MPAAAVIPAPIAYIKVVAVKKLVVGFLNQALGPVLCTVILEAGFILVEKAVGIRLSPAEPHRLL